MAKQTVREFWKLVRRDEALARQLDALPQESAAQTGAKVVAIAASRGFAFTAEELRDAENELSDAELDRVAGGSFQSNYHTSHMGDGSTRGILIGSNMLASRLGSRFKGFGAP